MPPKAKAVTGGGASALPTKERALFARLVQEYENKKYKLGLKTAETILKKFPEHGETLCMKGLILASTGQRQQGLELAKQGVRKDLMSFISWHALGIMNRMDKNYDEAIKCYSQALKIEGGTNLNLLRESGYMYMQSRNYPPLIEQRSNLLRMQPHIRSNWAALATAYHLAGRLDEAGKVLAQWDHACRDVPAHNYEHSEMLLYRGSILYEAKRYQDLLTFFEKTSTNSRVVDKRVMRTLQAKAHLQLDQLAESEKIWRKLVEENEEEHAFIEGWLSSKGVKMGADAQPDDAVNNVRAVQQLEDLRSLFPKSHSAQRIELFYRSGPAFAESVELYLSRAFTKGIPSIFVDLKALLPDEKKRKVIEKVALSLLDRFSPSTSLEEPPSSFLWTLCFLAQFYSHLGQADLALTYIQSAIAHTPTLPELYMTKARILKRAGALEAGSHAMEDARLLDGQDRFLNSKDAKYKLRIGQFDEAEKVMGMFTKPDAPSPVADLLEMQAIWFILEEGLCFEEYGQLHLALKRYAQTEKIFEDHWDDQLDFHSYCTRKFTLRDYIDMVRWEDGIREHRAYIASSLKAIGIYLAVHDDPTLSDPDRKGKSAEDVKANGTNGTLSEEQRKEEKKRQKKAAEAKRKEDEEKKKQEAIAKAKAKAKGSAADEEEMVQAPPDPDPQGLALLANKEPLKEAERLVKLLQLHAGDKDARVWVATFEVAIRTRNWLLCARAIKKGIDLLAQTSKTGSQVDTQTAGRLHVQLLQLLKGMPDLSSAPPAVQLGIQTALDGIRPPSDVSLERINDDYLQKTSDALSWSQAALVLSATPEQQTQLKERILSTAVNHVSSEQSSLPTLLALQKFLTGQSIPSSTLSFTSEELEPFRKQAHEKFPLAEAFLTAQQRQERAEERMKSREAWEAAVEDGLPFPLKQLS